jgi:hypothetical protein
MYGPQPARKVSVTRGNGAAINLDHFVWRLNHLLLQKDVVRTTVECADAKEAKTSAATRPRALLDLLGMRGVRQA